MATLPELIYSPTKAQSGRMFPELGVRFIVVHDPEGGYKGAISTCKNVANEVSYHGILREDGKEFTQLVPWNRKSWSCRVYNSISENICIAGFYNRTYDDHALEVLARIVAFRLHKRQLPATAVLPGQVGMHEGRGFTQHKFLGVLGGNHRDFVNTDEKWKRFAALVKAEAKRGGFRKTWGRSNP